MVSSDRTGVNGQKLILNKFHLNINKHFFWLEKVSLRGCGLSILEDINDLAGHGSGQPAPADPA